jgi:hypothetical protein
MRLCSQQTRDLAVLVSHLINSSSTVRAAPQQPPHKVSHEHKLRVRAINKLWRQSTKPSTAHPAKLVQSQGGASSRRSHKVCKKCTIAVDEPAAAAAKLFAPPALPHACARLSDTKEMHWTPSNPSQRHLAFPQLGACSSQHRH